MSKRGRQAPPISPGEVLRSWILRDTKITQEELAEAIGVSRFSVNQIMNGRRSVTADMALRLAHATSTTPEYWLDLQRNVDLYNASLKLRGELKRLKVVRLPKSDDELFVDLE
jgi:addiction module HigA family antidote